MGFVRLLRMLRPEARSAKARASEDGAAEREGMFPRNARDARDRRLRERARSDIVFGVGWMDADRSRTSRSGGGRPTRIRHAGGGRRRDRGRLTGCRFTPWPQMTSARRPAASWCRSGAGCGAALFSRESVPAVSGVTEYRSGSRGGPEDPDPLTTPISRRSTLSRPAVPRYLRA